MPTVGVSLVGAATAAAERMQTIQPSEGVVLEEEGRSLPLRESQRACLFLNVEHERMCMRARVCVYMCMYVCVYVFTRRTRGLLSEASKAPVGADSFGGYGGGRGSRRKGVDVREGVREKRAGRRGGEIERDLEPRRKRDRDWDRARESAQCRE